ncbi:MAG: RrF2 family transcriptional regulator [Fidelibacterota bacterium]
MRLSMTGEYAVRAMLHLSSKGYGNMVQISEVSREQKIPESILRKIIGQLVKAGVLYSLRGKGGGVSLARQPETISLLEIVEAIEGKIFLNQCLIGPDFCERTGYCAVHLVWREVQEKMVDILGNRNMAALVQEHQERFYAYLGGAGK